MSRALHLFRRALARALPPRNVTILLGLLALGTLFRRDPLPVEDGRDLANVRLAWFGLAAVFVTLGFGAFRVGKRWRDDDRHWLGARLASPASWFRVSFAAALVSLAVGFALLTASLAHGSRVTRPATERVATRSVERLALVSDEREITLAFDAVPNAETLLLPLHAIAGTGSPLLCNVRPDRGRERTLLVEGRQRVELEVDPGVSRVTLERLDGTAILLVAPDEIEAFVGESGEWRTYFWLLASLIVWACLPLGLGLALAARLSPLLAFGLVAGLAALASTSGLAPFGLLNRALELFEWNAHDRALVASELPRAFTGVACGILLVPGRRSDLAQGGSE